MSLEKPNLKLGFIPLTDCAPLIVAQELGLFAEEGLNVSLSREASWANVRDRLSAGLLDGAHLLGPLAVAQSLRLGGAGPAITAPMALNLNGSAITVSKALGEQLRMLDAFGMSGRPRTAQGLKRLIDSRRARLQPPLTFAVVFPYSIHNYELRYWLAAGGVHPDHDVRLVVVPPARLVDRLAAGEIDGFCVTAPWNSLAVQEGLGEIMLCASEWWGLGPDKVFGVTRAFARECPRTLRALARALLRAAAWADAPENRPALAAMLAEDHYVGVGEPVIRASLLGGAPGGPAGLPSDFIVLHRYAANFPWRSHATWFLTQMIRWGQAPREADFASAAAVYDPDLYREVAADLGTPAPTADHKVEGAQRKAWTMKDATSPIQMAPDAFFDGMVFDPATPLAYVDAFPLSRPAMTQA